MSDNTVPVQYLEKPVTADEIKIASILDRIIKAIATKNVKLLISVYSDTASIEMSTSRGALLSKKEYETRMSKIIGNVRNICFHNTIIRINGQEATISCVNVIFLNNKALPEKNQRYFKCAKENGEWRIIEASYI